MDLPAPRFHFLRILLTMPLKFVNCFKFFSIEALNSILVALLILQPIVILMPLVVVKLLEIRVVVLIGVYNFAYIWARKKDC